MSVFFRRFAIVFDDFKPSLTYVRNDSDGVHVFMFNHKKVKCEQPECQVIEYSKFFQRIKYNTLQDFDKYYKLF